MDINIVYCLNNANIDYLLLLNPIKFQTTQAHAILVCVSRVNLEDYVAKDDIVG